jgi:urease accessory protein
LKTPLYLARALLHSAQGFWEFFMKLRWITLALACVLTPGLAFAHPGGAHTHGVWAGFSHPFTGADHALAMASVGLLAMFWGGRALWGAPIAFLAAMGLAGAAAMQGVGIGYVEIGIGLGVVALGLALALQWRAPVALGALFCAMLAVFHGAAHGAEAPADASALAYGIGFLAGAAMLIGAGMGLGFALRHRAPASAKRVCGGAIAATGLFFLANI